jgi:alcohol dehydrogenase
MTERTVYRLPKAGSIKDLRAEKEALNSPAPDEVSVRVHAIGLNFANIFAIQGLYSATPKGPFIPGLEFSGEVTAVGSAVKEVRVGDRVMGATRFGGYVSHINIHHRYVVPLPNEWSFEEGAGFLVQGLTAWYALSELGNLQRGMTVLIHSAAGGVGILANRICKKFDAFTIGTVGNASKLAYLKQQEAYDKVIVRDQNFYNNLRQSLGDRPLHLVLECIGGKILMQGWKAMAPMGRMVVYGNASFTTHSDKPAWLSLYLRYLKRPKIDPLRLPTQNKSLMGFNLIYLYEQTDLLHKMLNTLMALDLRAPHVGHLFEFGEMQNAVRALQGGKTTGKVVVKV